MMYNWRLLDKMKTSPCCDAPMTVKEVGESQLSYDLQFYCNQCKNRLDKH